MATIVLPGSTIGIFGSGQLGRMMATAAKQMGYRVHTFSPETDSPTGQVADYECVASYDDVDAVKAFINNTDVVTFEFENIDASVADIAQRLDIPVHPGAWVLRTAQNRIREKSTLREAGLPVTPFWPVNADADLIAAAYKLGFPIVLKTASSGYDGKGQIVAHRADELNAAWQDMGCKPAIAEAMMVYAKEVSVVNTRSACGKYSAYSVIENLHNNHILDLSAAPARIPDSVARKALEIAKCVMEALDAVGTLCVEFFVTKDDELLINEIAPRPHNSGHLTIEGAYTSQFEQHIRAICGLPLGDTVIVKATAMANLLGDLWADGTPDWNAALAHPEVKLHLYGKREARAGRKMGHITAVADDVATAIATVMDARRSLQGTVAGAQDGSAAVK